MTQNLDFALGQRPPFSTLVYPVPPSNLNIAGLGVHYTIDVAGEAKFGPDVQWVDSPEVDLNVCASRVNGFYKSIRKYWPGLKDGALAPDYAGLRPKLSGAGESSADFGFFCEREAPGMVHLLGIESPGLTSSLAIGDYVVENLAKQLDAL